MTGYNIRSFKAFPKPVKGLWTILQLLQYRHIGKWTTLNSIWCKRRVQIIRYRRWRFLKIDFTDLSNSMAAWRQPVWKKRSNVVPFLYNLHGDNAPCSKCQMIQVHYLGVFFFYPKNKDNKRIFYVINTIRACQRILGVFVFVWDHLSMHIMREPAEKWVETNDQNCKKMYSEKKYPQYLYNKCD